jgi:hypothetical protein
MTCVPILNVEDERKNRPDKNSTLEVGYLRP